MVPWMLGMVYGPGVDQSVEDRGYARGRRRGVAAQAGVDRGPKPVIFPSLVPHISTCSTWSRP